MRGARCSMSNGLMACVRAFADRAHAVERGNAESGGEVAVGAAAGGGFVEREAELAARAWACGKRRTVPRLRSMGGRLMSPVTVSLQRGSCGLSAANLRAMRAPSARRGMRTSTSAQAWAGMTLLFVPPGSDADADGEAALEVGPTADFFNDAGELANGVGAFFEVDAGVGGDAFDFDAPVADAFAGGFVGQALRRLEDIDGRAGVGDGFGDGPRGGAADLFVAVE